MRTCPPITGTPICTGTVSYTAAGDCNIADSQTLEGVTFNGNGHTITGLTTQTGVRGAQAGQPPRRRAEQLQRCRLHRL